jgi:hypothetical protein
MEGALYALFDCYQQRVGNLKSEMPPEVGVLIFKMSMLLVQFFIVILGTPGIILNFLKEN